MIIYSVIPWEIVFENYDKSSMKMIEMEYLGEKVLVLPTEGNEYVINRIISTSPKAFLNPQLQPGSIIPGSKHNIPRV